MDNFTWDSRSLNDGNPHTASGANRKGGGIELSDLNSYIEIPQYSTINSATLTVYFKETTNRMGNADLYVDLTDSATLGSSTKRLDYGNGVVPKNDPANHASRSIDLIEKECITTSGANVGNISYGNARYLIISFQSAFLSRTYSYYFVLSIDYTPHTCSWNSGTITTQPTCTTAGVKTYTCSVCGATKTESIPALNHSWKAATYTWSSDGKTCTAKRVCNNNSAHTETATATITSAVKTAASCTAKGTTRYTAKFSVSWASTQTKDVQDIAAKGHTWKNATCTAPKSCTVCNATEGSALGHSYTGEIKSNGNGEDATHSFKCVNGCNQYGGAVKHTWNDGVITKQPTCLSYGVKTYTCTVNGCGATYTDSVPPKGHNYIAVVTPPTETANGYTTHTCENDSSHSYVSSITCLATFKNYDDSVLKTEIVKQGDVPTAPPDPSRIGYKFVRWSSMVGAINNSTVFTAVFEKILPPEITSVQMLYQNNQISAANKVPAGEYFRIVVGAKSFS